MKGRKNNKQLSYQSFKLSKLSVENLNRLFDSMSPKELRENLLEIYHTYLIYAHDTLPIDFPKMSSNIYLLIKSLDTLNEEWLKKKSQTS